MEEIKSSNWDLELSELEQTSDPSVYVNAKGVPTLTVATMLGITALVVVAIVMVFVLGILIDCRQQRIMDRKIDQLKRRRTQRRINVEARGDIVRIAENMEESGISPAPVEILREIP
ncbi:unnamed protein product [Leptosia nina]|uniref:Uncharacterized protein n=1 Tax=Leptosia nina TaxID=320188 RepID=A0AAV1JRE7_9NEOP